MKYFLITLTFLLFMSGCSYQNAFSKFNMTKEEELLAANTQSSKIESKEKIEGVFTAIYLNNVYKESFTKDENFLIAVYMKDPETTYDFKLNKHPSLTMKKIKKLEEFNEFTTLMKTKEKWNEYYLVVFESMEKELHLSIEKESSFSSELLYLKD